MIACVVRVGRLGVSETRVHAVVRGRATGSLQVKLLAAGEARIVQDMLPYR